MKEQSEEYRKWFAKEWITVTSQLKAGVRPSGSLRVKWMHDVERYYREVADSYHT